MGLVQGIPLVGLQLSNAFSQNMLAAVVGDVEHARITLGYWVVAGFSVAFVAVFALAAGLSASRVAAELRAKGETEDPEKTFAAMLKRSPDSVGLPSIAPLPVAEPAMRRAMSAQVPPKRRSPAKNRRSISVGHAVVRTAQQAEGS